MELEFEKDKPGVGSLLAASGAYVLKLNVAGSGDKSWRKYDKNKDLDLVGDTWKTVDGKPKFNATSKEITETYGPKEGRDEYVRGKYKKIYFTANGINEKNSFF